MTSQSDGAGRDERLLTFEIGASLYALPISAVVEVTEVEDGFAAVPTLSASVGGVINFHGDALPVILPAALLGVESGPPKRPTPVVVVADRSTEKARLGLPVDEILGLVYGPRAVSRGADPVAERRPIDGRVASVLDPVRLVASAAVAIEQSLVGSE